MMWRKQGCMTAWPSIQYPQKSIYQFWLRSISLKKTTPHLDTENPELSKFLPFKQKYSFACFISCQKFCPSSAFPIFPPVSSIIVMCDKKSESEFDWRYTKCFTLIWPTVHQVSRISQKTNEVVWSIQLDWWSWIDSFAVHFFLMDEFELFIFNSCHSTPVNRFNIQWELLDMCRMLHFLSICFIKWVHFCVCDTVMKSDSGKLFMCESW